MFSVTGNSTDTPFARIWMQAVKLDIASLELKIFYR